MEMGTHGSDQCIHDLLVTCCISVCTQVSDDDQCALCGQLMGMAEFLHATLGKSSPRIFKFEHEKYAIKRVGAYSLVRKLIFFPVIIKCTYHNNPKS